jgi:hypothetical protein
MKKDNVQEIKEALKILIHPLKNDKRSYLYSEYIERSESILEQCILYIESSKIPASKKKNLIIEVEHEIDNLISIMQMNGVLYY